MFSQNSKTLLFYSFVDFTFIEKSTKKLDEKGKVYVKLQYEHNQFEIIFYFLTFH